jgi:hypothetical protein
VTIGGCGRCSGFASTPWPISGISVRALKDIDRGGVEIGAEESLRRQFAARIAHQQLANWHRGQAATVPNGGSGACPRA